MSARKTAFTYELRILACANCGAPVEAGLEGGRATCSYCNTVNELVERDESRDRARAAQPPGISEAQRIDRLREQDGKPLLPPASLQHLVEGGLLPAANASAAAREWFATRGELQRGASFTAAERLYLLTLLLCGHYATQRKDREARALMESALDLLDDPRHRQVLHGMLARDAAREGDLEAAESWLELCSAQSDDIHADSAYRVSRAYLATRARNFHAVLEVLGPTRYDVPIADNWDDMCTVLRANAYEKLDQAERAAHQLLPLLFSAGGETRARLIESTNAVLELCPRSLPVAQMMMQGAVRTRWPGASAWVVAAVASVMVAYPLGVFVSSALGLGMDIEKGAAGGFVFGFAVLGLVGTGLLAWFVSSRRRRRALQANARVLSVNPTGRQNKNGVPEFELAFTVETSAAGRYLAIHTEVLTDKQRARAGVGSVLPVLVHPTDRKQVMIDWSAA